MSVGLATELNYLDKQDSQLDEMLEKQLADGDVAARNRRRKNRPDNTPVEVNNKETKKLTDSLTSYKNKIATLSQVLDDILAVNQQIVKKMPTV